MTSEERWTKIENALATVAKHQTHHAEEISELRELHKNLTRTQGEEIRELRELHKSLTIAVPKLGEFQRETDGKLNALIDTVDRIIRRPNQL